MENVMRRLINMGCTLILSGFFFGCATFLNMGDAGPITGTWTGLNQRGSKVIMTFDEDRTMKMVVNTTNGSVETKGKFRIDYSGAPYSLDLYELDTPGSSSAAELQAVVSFPAENRMIYIGKYAVNGHDDNPGVSDSPHMMHVELERTE